MPDDERDLRESLTERFIASATEAPVQKSRDLIGRFLTVVDCPLYDVTPEFVYYFLDQLRDAKPSEEEWKQSVSVLKQFAAFAASEGAIKSDPFQPLKRGRPRVLEGGSKQSGGEMAITSRGWMEPVIAPDLELSLARTDPNAFRALYFPYGRCFSHSFLKRALLIFNELWFLDPLDRTVRSDLCLYRNDGLSSSPHWSTFIEVYDELYETGFVRIFNDFSLFRQYDLLLARCIDSDLTDPAFSRTVASEVKLDYWHIHRNRLPLELPTSFIWDRHRGNSEEASPWYRSPGQSEGTYHDFNSPYIMTIAHGIVHPAIGMAATINQAILTSGLRGLVPVSDSSVSLNLLRLKYERALRSASEGGSRTVPGNLLKSDYASAIARVGFEILRSTIPDEELEKRTYGELIHYRSESADLLARFQVQLNQICSQVRSSSWDNSFEVEIKRLLDKEVIPQITKLRDDLTTVYEKMFGSILAAAIKAVSPTLVLSAFPGLSLSEILVWGLSVGAGLSAISIEPLIEAWRRERELSRNGVAWLIKLK
jgi:hypothetical protein